MNKLINVHLLFCARVINLFALKHAGRCVSCLVEKIPFRILVTFVTCSGYSRLHLVQSNTASDLRDSELQKKSALVRTWNSVCCNATFCKRNITLLYYRTRRLLCDFPVALTSSVQGRYRYKTKRERLDDIIKALLYCRAASRRLFYTVERLVYSIFSGNCTCQNFCSQKNLIKEMAF